MPKINLTNEAYNIVCKTLNDRIGFCKVDSRKKPQTIFVTIIKKKLTIALSKKVIKEAYDSICAYGEISNATLQSLFSKYPDLINQINEENCDETTNNIKSAKALSEKVCDSLNGTIGHCMVGEFVQSMYYPIYVRIAEENKTIALSKKYIKEVYDSICEHGEISTELLLSLLNKYPGLLNQLKDKEKLNILVASNNENASSLKEVIPLPQINNFFQNAFKVGIIKWDNSLGLYVFSYKQKGKKNKVKEKKELISAETSLKISKLENMGADYFEVLKCLEKENAVIKSNLLDIYVTKDGFINENGAYEDIEVLENLIEKWNSYYTTEVFLLKNSSVVCAGKNISKKEFNNLLKEKDLDSFLLITKEIVNRTIEDAIYIGDSALEEYFKDKYEETKSYINKMYDAMKNTTIKNLNFIKKNLNLFDNLSSSVIDKILLYKRGISDTEDNIIRYYKTIEVRRGPFKFLYSKELDGLKEVNLSDKNIVNAICKIKEINEFSTIETYIMAKDKIYAYSKELVLETLNTLINVYPDEEIYINGLEKSINSDIEIFVSRNLKINKNSIVIFKDIPLDINGEEALNSLVESSLNEECKSILDKYEKSIKRLIEDKKHIGSILSTPHNKLIIGCINTIKKKGITTYANVLAGKKHTDGDKDFYGCLSSYSISDIVLKIRKLINEDILVEVNRKASFGRYTSIEIGSKLSNYNFSNRIIDCASAKEELVQIEENKPNEYLSLLEYIKSTNYLRDIKNYHILKSIDMEGIKLLIDTLEEQTISSSKILNKLKNILKETKKLDDSILYYIRFQINISKAPRVKNVLEAILKCEEERKGI